MIHIKKTSIAYLLFMMASFAQSQDTTFFDHVDKLVVSDGILLEIIRSEKSMLQIDAPDLSSDCIIQTTEKGKLTLKRVSSIDCNGEIRAVLHVPSLKSIEIMGNAEVSTRNLIQTDTLLIEQRSGGVGYIDMDLKYLKVIGSEGSLLRAEGYAIQQNISLTTKASFSGFELEGEQVEIESTSGAVAKVCANKSLKANARAGGYIGYKCHPDKKDLNTSFGGTIKNLSE